MFSAEMSSEEKLRVARELFERTIDHYRDRNVERRLAQQFYANTNMEGQWDTADLEYLREEGRPALTFNMIKPKVDALVGMMEDVQMVARARPVGAEDKWKAQALNDLLDRARDQVKADALDDEVVERGMITGEGDAYLDVQMDPENPQHIRFTAKMMNPMEVKWDTGSEKANRDDANYVLIDKWLTEAEFKVEYPEHADRWKELFDKTDPDYDISIAPKDMSESTQHYIGDRDYEDQRITDYFERRRRRIRVIHIEWMEPYKRTFLVAEEGVVEEVPERLAGKVRSMKEQGAAFHGTEIVETWDKRVRWFEFIHNEVLYDKPSPVPWKCFSAVPFTCFLDWTDNISYGFVRNFMDPQREINKSYSQMLDHTVSQSKPGLFAEQDAVIDEKQAEDSLNRGGGITWLEKGGMQRIQERQPARLAEGAYRRHENAKEVFDRIGGIATDMEGPSSHAEAATTVQIRYRRAQLSMRTVFKHFQSYQVAMAKAILEAIMRSMPDEQIELWLGNKEKYQVREGQVVVLQPDPQTGEPKPVSQFSIRDLRAMHFDIELDTGTLNNTLRLMELQALAELKRLEVPIDPTLLVEKATASRHDRERLVEFADRMTKLQGAAAQQERMLTAQQIQQSLQLEEKKRAIEGIKAAAAAGKVEETERHDRATEHQARLDSLLGADLKRLEIWERADESEKQTLERIAQRQEQRRAAATGGA